MNSSSSDVAISAPAPVRRLSRLQLASLLLLAVAVILPVAAAGSPFVLTLSTHALIAAILAVSLDLLTGQCGLLTFGHAGWYGVGAYAAGLFAQRVTGDILAVVLVGTTVTALLALLTGPVLIRQSGKAFAILTLALSQVFYTVTFIASDITGGEDGLQGIPRATLLGYRIAQGAAWYYLVLTVLVLACTAILFVGSTPAGKAWRAIRTNEQRALFIGIDTTRHKLLVYVLSAALAGLAGSLYVLYNGATTPETMHWLESGRVLMYVILGGVGTVVGPALGAVLFVLTEHYVSTVTGSWMIYFGAIFVLAVVSAPGGIFGRLGIRAGER